ncbi:MAG: hypothetical protein KIT63_14440 [Rhodoferax sp.]|nr:hypothetical protein [Rhodoferax sp.]
MNESLLRTIARQQDVLEAIAQVRLATRIARVRLSSKWTSATEGSSSATEDARVPLA